MKSRLRDAVNHAGGIKPAGLAVLSGEDFSDMPPLNTPEGQRWMDGFIVRNGPFDLIFFDNIQASVLLAQIHQGEGAQPRQSRRLR